MFEIREYGSISILGYVTAQGQDVLHAVTLQFITHAVNFLTCGCHTCEVGQGECFCVVPDVLGYHCGVGQGVAQRSVCYAHVIRVVTCQLLNGFVNQGKCILLSLGRENLK